MKLFRLLSLFIFIGLSASAQNAPKLSPLTRIFLDKYERSTGTLPSNYVYRKGADNKTYISALIKVGPSINGESLSKLGVKINTRAGRIWTAMVPLEQLAAFTTAQGIEYIQLDEPIFPTLDSVRKATRVDSVHSGLGGLPSQYHGDNVVVGVIDAGFDYKHPSLFDTTGTRYRVKRVWEQVIAGTPPAGMSYGNEITDTLTMWSEGTDLPGFSHGAHVAGIAAGGGFDSTTGIRYRGVADAADLVIVGITPPPSDWTSTGMGSIIDGMSYIYKYGASVGKPAVANLSWGCSMGPHDGLSLFSQACDTLTGPGKIFVCSAGNNGNQKIHIGKTFTATDTVVNTFLRFNPFLPQKKTWVDIWGDTSKSYCIQLSLFQGANKIDSTADICLDNLLHNITMIGSNLDTFFASIVTSDTEFNGKPRIFLDIYSKVGDSVLITIKATDGKINMWTGYVDKTTGYYGEFATNNFPWAVPGDVVSTIGDMASTRSAIAVGAYNSKRNYVNVSGNNVSYGITIGQIATFSSRGPSADGRIKPDITAPGMVIASAISSYDSAYHSTGASYSTVHRKWIDLSSSREYSYAMLQGTSMSSPVATGIVALMLQVWPTLTPAQVIKAISETAIKDNFTGILPGAGNYIWGAGKINAMGAINKALVYLGVDDQISSAHHSLTVYPNPATGQFSIACETTKASTATLEILDMLGRKQYSSTWQQQHGYNELSVNAAGWARGIYLARLTSAGRQSTARVVIQ
jgi:subtilisin family serine protease